MKKIDNSKNIVSLHKALLQLNTIRDAESFLSDLMTNQEIAEMERRFKAAGLLINKYSYSKIIKITGLSSTTVARVSKCVKARQSGYKTIIQRLQHHSHLAKLPRGVS